MDDAFKFEEFVNARAGAMLRYAYVLTGNPHDAADLVQESLVKLRAAWPRVTAKGNPEGYLRTIMARTHISLWRRWRREHSTAVLPEQAFSDDALNRAEGDSGMWEALASLPRRQRAVLVLRYYENLTDEEIATVLGVSRGTVRSQASRALDKLRSSWRISSDATLKPIQESPR